MPGNKLYPIEYLQSIFKEDLSALSNSAKKQIKKAIEQRLTNDPIGFGKPLRYSLKGQRRLRVGDYRIIYRIEITTHTVLITAVRRRKDIYLD